MESADHRKRDWHDLTRKIRARIRSQLINSGIDIQHCTFITKRRLRGIWTGDLFAQLKLLLSRDDIETLDFVANTIYLVSSLINYEWSPFSGADQGPSPFTLQKDGLFSSVLNHCFTDSDLPLPPSSIRAIFGHNADDFKDGQHAFNPAIIDDQGEGFCSFPEGTRLPFEYEQHEPHERRPGWYGQVFKVRLTRGHFRKPGFDFAKPVACKTIRHSRENFLQELQNLELIGQNAISSEHIVTHIVAILTDPSKFDIIFPWAWSDLAHFLRLERERYPSWLDPQHVTPQTLLAEIGYVAQALEFLHNRIYTSDQQRVALYHMDLKPDNILIFEPTNFRERQKHPIGLWKITDFGVSDSETVRGIGDLIGSSSLPPTSPSKPLSRQSGPYQAPEVERRYNFRNSDIDHAKADLWSYGTVAIEVLAFAIGGGQGVQNLKRALARSSPDNDRQYRPGYFFLANAEGEYMLHPALIDHFENDDDDVSPYPQSLWYGELWDCIKYNALRIDPSSRSTAEDFYHLLIAQSTRLRELILPSPLTGPDSELNDDFEPAIQIPFRVPFSQSGVLSSTQTSLSISRAPTSVRRTSWDPASGRTGAVPSTDQAASFSTNPPISTGVGLNGAGSTLSAPISSPPEAPVSLRPSPAEQIESWPISATSSSWQASTICDQAREPFLQHLTNRHQFRRMPKFVALSRHGPYAVFSDGKHLCRAHVPTRGDGEVVCAGEIIRQGLGEIELEEIKFSAGYVAVHDMHDRIILQLIGDHSPALASRSDSYAAARKSIVRFDVAHCGLMAIEYSESIGVYRENGRRCLQYSKPFNENLVGLAFSESNDALFAATRDRYLVWQYSDGTQTFSLQVELSHRAISEAQSVRSLLIPTGSDMRCLMQSKECPRAVHLLTPSTCTSIAAESPSYYVSGRLIPIVGGGRILCFGHWRRTLRWSEDALLILESDEYGGPPLKLHLSGYRLLGTRLCEHASIETAICVVRGNHMCVRIVDLDGAVRELPIGSAPRDSSSG